MPHCHYYLIEVRRILSAANPHYHHKVGRLGVWCTAGAVPSRVREAVCRYFPTLGRHPAYAFSVIGLSSPHERPQWCRPSPGGVGLL